MLLTGISPPHNKKESFSTTLVTGLNLKKPLETDWSGVPKLTKKIRSEKLPKLWTTPSLSIHIQLWLFENHSKAENEHFGTVFASPNVPIKQVRASKQLLKSWTSVSSSIRVHFRSCENRSEALGPSFRTIFESSKLDANWKKYVGSHYHFTIWAISRTWTLYIFFFSRAHPQRYKNREPFHNEAQTHTHHRTCSVPSTVMMTQPSKT